ncbi:TetR/AcrR family transcriptional regulator [Robinsoniella peoriensis]|uniref:TetR/AcrR family transcriptional regulator n=1 Tax=Robinsoniella peoriensis TaxID=180332 RepID=UPI0036401404
MTTRAEQKAKREEEILIASIELFIKKGYASTKTSEISKSINISEGLLFHYFKTKEILLETLVDIALQKSDTWTGLENPDPITYFEQVAESVLRCLKEDEMGSKFFILIAQLKQSEGIPKHIYEKVKSREQDADKIAEIIKRGQQMGTIRQGNPYALTYLFSNTLQAIAVQYALHSKMPFPEVEWIVDMLRNH